MNIIGLIAEYNPFHNGHLFQINKIKKLYPNSILIVVLSSSFSQRGEPITLTKWERTNIILNYGVDLVVELPYSFSTQAADVFAKGSIEILNALKIDTLIFGIEKTKLEDLIKVAKIQLDDNFNTILKDYLKQKFSYKVALSKTIKSLTNINITDSNDTLAVSYIKEVLIQNKKINIFPIKRTCSYLTKETDKNITSASNIREKLLNDEDIKSLVPKETYNYLKEKSFDLDIYFNLLKYKTIISNDLNKFLMVDEGIENRILKYINNSNNFNDLVNNICTKRYTQNKIRRTLCHILNNFTKDLKEEFNNAEYIRILGFNESGKNYLNSIKKEIYLPIITNYKKGYKMLDFEVQVTKIYDILTNTNISNLEYTNKPIIFNKKENN